MGFNLRSAHHGELFTDGGHREAAALTARFGSSLPLGSPGLEFCVADEMGWSWWSELQALARERLGERGSRSMHATDAWLGVYLDTEVERELVWPNGKPDEASRTGRKSTVVTIGPKPAWGTRVLQAIGLRPRSTSVPPEINAVMEQMVKAYGAREGEYGALQVGSLRRVLAEAEELLKSIGTEPNQDAVESVRRSYSEDDARCDDDPAIQCLCHLWITAKHALEHRQPMWLVK